MMRFLTGLSVGLATCLAAPALADEAFVIGTEDYDSLQRFRRGTEVVDAADTLVGYGYDVVAAADTAGADIARLLRQFAQGVTATDRVIVVLSGRFVTDGTRTWYIPRDYSAPRIDTVGQSAVSVETLLLILADAPGAAVLVLSTDAEDDGAYDRWLSAGIGPLDLPQGVTLVQGGPRNVARLLSQDLARPGADLMQVLAEDENLIRAGFLPQSLLLTAAADAPEVGPAPTPLVSEAERALWEGAVALDTEAAYTNYLSRYPNGVFAEEAQNLRDIILSEPNRDARLAEEALRLSRNDRRDVQRALTLLTFNTRGIDGIFGPGTRGAITNWQQHNGFAQTGYLNGEQIVRLEAQAALRQAEIEAEQERQRQQALAADRAYWEETGAAGAEPGLRAYVERYPDGIYADAARTRLATFEAERLRLAEEEERTMWERAEAADTLAGFQTYLETYPSGAHAEAAQARIEELSTAEDNVTARQAARAVEDALGLNQLTRQLIEAQLDGLGFEPGLVDGEFDRDTRGAIRRYQRDNGLERTGFLDENLVVVLLAETLQGP